VLNPSGGAPSSGGDTGTGGDGSGGNSGSCDATGFHISGTKLLDSKCNEFVMRGVNYPYVWFKDSQATDAKLVDIAGVGSNAVRIVMATGGQWARTSGNEVSQLISWAKQNKMVALLEVHDSTGFPEQGPAEDPQNAVDYWLSSDIRAAIDGEEAYVLINIANEAFGNGANKDEDSTRWESFYTGAVAELRTAGLKHTLVVDAPNWGQDWQWIMRDGEGAQHIMHADPDKNVAFSVHMYQIFDQASVVQTYMDNFLSSGLPLIVGEFAADHGDSGDVAEGTILDEAMARGVGYLGWSWSGNGAGLESLDITQNFDVGSLSTWGGILINDPNGITASSTICTCFD
jgi:mannan endo-1,4-beta-mannosidase